MLRYVALLLLLPTPLPVQPLTGGGQDAAGKAEPEVTREAVCRWAKTPPVLDGKLDDPAWKDAQVIDRFAAFWSKTALPKTSQAYLVWDDEALYYAAKLTDAELRSFGTERNDSLWNGDVFEMFFRPDPAKLPYYEFQANPKSVVFEMFFPGGHPGLDSKAAAPLGSKAVAVVDGTLDQPGDTDRSWTVEGRIPWTAFAPTGGKPRPGATWTFALCRYDYGPEGTQPVLMSSAPLTQPNFHRKQDYGKLTFEGPKE